MLVNHGEGAAKCTRARGGFVRELVSELSLEGQEDPIGGSPRSLGPWMGSMGTGLGLQVSCSYKCGTSPNISLERAGVRIRNGKDRVAGISFQ